MTRIHQLHLGHVRLPDSHPRAAQLTCAIYSYAIDHPDGVIVIDTGPRAGHPIIDDLYAPEVMSIVDALNTAGIDERDVAAVANTHLHFDHCGQNHLLDRAAVWITQAELDVSTTDFYTVPEWAKIEPDRLRLAADGEAIAAGVTILHTPGHTPGHLSVTARTDTGLDIIVGQACYTCAEYDAATLQTTDTDAGNGAPIDAVPGSTFTDSRGLSFRVNPDCSLSDVPVPNTSATQPPSNSPVHSSPISVTRNPAGDAFCASTYGPGVQGYIADGSYSDPDGDAGDMLTVDYGRGYEDATPDTTFSGSGSSGTFRLNFCGTPGETYSAVLADRAGNGSPAAAFSVP